MSQRKEVSAAGIQSYLETGRKKQGLREARSILETFWIKNRPSILSTFGSVREDIKSIFSQYKMDHLAQAMDEEWGRHTLETGLNITGVLNSFGPRKAAHYLRELLRNKDLGRGELEPDSLLAIARMTRFPELTQYIARIIRKRQLELAYQNFRDDIQRLLDDPLAFNENFECNERDDFMDYGAEDEAHFIQWEAEIQARHEAERERELDRLANEAYDAQYNLRVQEGLRTGLLSVLRGEATSEDMVSLEAFMLADLLTRKANQDRSQD